MRKSFKAAFGAAVLFVAANAHGVLFFSDNFSTFTPGNLAGQAGYVQLGTSALNPLQVSGGKVVIPAVTGNVDGQDVYKNYQASALTAPTTVYLAFTVTVDVAPTIAPSYFIGSSNSVDGGGFINFRLAVRQNNTAGAPQFGARVNGQGAAPFAYGTANIVPGVENLVVAVLNITGAVSNTVSLYVNPTTLDLSGDTPYATGTMGATGTPVTGVGSLIFSQFQSGTAGQAGLKIGGVAAGSTATAVLTAIPEPSALGLLAPAGVLLARRRRA